MKIEVLKDAQRRIKVGAEALRHIGDACNMCGAVRFVGHIAVKDRYTALLNNSNAADQRQQSRFADTVRTDQADHTASGDLNRNIVERDRSPVAMGNALDLGDDAVGHWRSFTVRGEALLRDRPAMRWRSRCGRSPCRARRSSLAYGVR